jgi:cysteine desulfurase
MAAMIPYFSAEYGNPGGLYGLGQRAREAVEASRRSVARVLGCSPNEVIFTSGGTESDNMALRGIAFARDGAAGMEGGKPRSRHIVTSAVEHHAVGQTCRDLKEHFGIDVTEVAVDSFGQVDPEDVFKAIRPETILISIMYANNEVGTIQPVAEIGRFARAKGIPFHTDAVQAAAYLPIDVDRLNVDLLAIGAHKLYGPKGAGVLYVRKGTALHPLLTGGGHEDERRAGTENVPAVVGLATALERAQAQRKEHTAMITPLRNRLIEGIGGIVAQSQLTGHASERLPNNASFVIEGVEAGAVLLGLDLAGIAASSGSACTSAMMEPSHVLTAMGVPKSLAAGALRLTLGPENTMEEMDFVVETVGEVVERLRILKD